jgi:hypothetical protein
MATMDNIHYNYDRMTKIDPITKFEDIEVGATYHIAPLIIYDRRDIIVERKDWNTISGTVIHSDGTRTHTTLYKTELSMRYLVRKHTIGKKKEINII